MLRIRYADEQSKILNTKVTHRLPVERMPGRNPDELTVVRISKGVFDRVDAFLKTRAAKELGLDSLKDVMDRAVVEFIQRHAPREGEESYKRLVNYFEKNPELLEKLGFESTGQLVEAAIKQTNVSERAVEAKKK